MRFVTMLKSIHHKWCGPIQSNWRHFVPKPGHTSGSSKSNIHIGSVNLIEPNISLLTWHGGVVPIYTTLETRFCTRLQKRREWNMIYMWPFRLFSCVILGWVSFENHIVKLTSNPSPVSHNLWSCKMKWKKCIFSFIHIETWVWLMTTSIGPFVVLLTPILWGSAWRSVRCAPTRRNDENFRAVVPKNHGFGARYS